MSWNSASEANFKSTTTSIRVIVPKLFDFCSRWCGILISSKETRRLTEFYILSSGGIDRERGGFFSQDNRKSFKHLTLFSEFC